MSTDQALFPLGIEPGIPQVCPWKELFATGTQATWLLVMLFEHTKINVFDIEQNASFITIDIH